MKADEKAQKAQRIKAARAVVVSGYDLTGDKQISPKDVVFIKREKHKETVNFWAYKMEVAGVSQTVFLAKQLFKSSKMSNRLQPSKQYQ